MTSGDDVITCGRCGADLGTFLRDAAVFLTASGLVIVGEDRAIHRCPTVTREDEANALRRCGRMLAEMRARRSPTIAYQ